MSCEEGESGSHHELVAARDVAHAGAVLIHDGEPLAAVLGGAGFVDEDDASVEKALFAGHAGEDRIGYDMGDTAQIIGVRRILLSRHLRAGQTSHRRKAVFTCRPRGWRGRSGHIAR